MSKISLALPCPKHPRHNLDAQININPNLNSKDNRFYCTMCHNEALRLGQNYDDFYPCIELMENSSLILSSPYFKDDFFAEYLEQYDDLLNKDVNEIIDKAMENISAQLESLRSLLQPYTDKFNKLKEMIGKFKCHINQQIGFEKLSQCYSNLKTQNLGIKSNEWNQLQQLLDQFIKQINLNNKVEYKEFPEDLKQQYEEISNFQLNTQSYYTEVVKVTRNLQVSIGQCLKSNFSLKAELILNEESSQKQLDPNHLELKLDQYQKQFLTSKNDQIRLITETFDKQQQQLLQLKQELQCYSNKTQESQINQIKETKELNQITTTYLQNNLQQPLDRLENEFKEFSNLRSESKVYNDSTINLIQKEIKPIIVEIQTQCQQMQVYEIFSNAIKSANQSNYNSTTAVIQKLQTSIDNICPTLPQLSKLCTPQFYETFKTHIKRNILRAKQIYKMGWDQKVAAFFFARILNKPNVITFIKTDNAQQLIGCYTPFAHQILNAWQLDDSLTSCVFSVTQNQLYPLKEANKANSICLHQSYLIYQGSDILISTAFGITSTLNSYYDASKYGTITNNTHLLTVANANVQEMEVYQLYFN